MATIALLGGTGDLGTGLAIRWSRAGHQIIIGSRTFEKAQAAAMALREINADISVTAMENQQAAAAGELVVLTVPFAHQIATLATVKEALTGKILIDVTVPLMPPKVKTVQLPEDGSAVAAAQAFLGDKVMVVSAFQNVSAELLKDPNQSIECHVLVAGNSKAARQTVIDLAAQAGMKAWHVGPIANSAAAEALTSLLIHINGQGLLAHAGVKIVGQDDH